MQNSFLIGRAKKALALIALSASALLVASCGGGGVASSNTVGGSLQVLPGIATVFPDTPVEFTISGGRAPYDVFSSNASVIPAPGRAVSGKFTAIPKLVQTGTEVTLTVRDGAGATSSTVLTVQPAVINNQVSFTVLAPTGTGCGTNAVCAGGDAQVVITASQNGLVLQNRAIRFDVFSGPYQFVTPGTGVLVNSLTINTDERGEAVARLRVTVSAPTQVATLQSTDVTSGLIRRFNFNVIQQTSGTGILTTLPSGNTTFTGPKGAAGQQGGCPVGSVDYYIYGGTPPYSVASPLPGLLTVSPSVVTTNGGSFTATIFGCGATQMIVTDATNRTVETSQVIGERGEAGDAPPATTAPTVSPAALTFTACAQSGTVSVTGTGTYTATVSTPGGTPGIAITPSSGNLPATITVTRPAGTAAPPAATTVTIANSAGTATLTVNVAGAAAAACP